LTFAKKQSWANPWRVFAIPVVGPGQVVDCPDENDCRHIVLAFLSIKIQNLQLFHLKGQCCLCPHREILLHDMASLIIVNLIILVMVNSIILVMVALV
jgi:hypothetical protein